MKKFAKIGVICLLALILALTGCSNKNNSTDNGNNSNNSNNNKNGTNTGNDSTSDGPTYGGIITYAYTQPFKGQLEPGFYQGEDDSLILNFIAEAMFMTGDDLKTYPNIATWTESSDHKTFTFKIKQGVKWHNGDELTAEDWKFAFEVIANKDSGSPRYENVEMVVGAQEFRDKTANTISGIKVIDPHTIEITVLEAAPNTLDNLWSYPMPKKYYESIPIDKLVDSEQVRQKPIGLGPFKVKKVQPGEFVEMERNDDYWKGKPLLDGVVYKIIDGSLATSLLGNGEIDMMQIPNSQYKDAEKLSNIELIKEDDLGYSYIGFKLGIWDADNEKIVMNNSKFADKRLRQAMAYAIDRQKLIDSFSNGLGSPLAVPMASVSWVKIPDDQINTYSYNPEKAKQILDEAGYKDTDGDGFREDPKGNKLTMNFDAMSGSEISEPRAQAIIQFFQDIGLNVKLNGGSLKDFNSFYDSVEADDPSVELFMGAWGLASDPDPSGLWRSSDEWNFPRWFTAESDRLIAEGISEKAFDDNYRKQVYYDWQKIVNEEMPMIFLTAPVNVHAHNKRLQGVHTNAFTNQVDTHLWWIKK